MCWRTQLLWMKAVRSSSMLASALVMTVLLSMANDDSLLGRLIVMVAADSAMPDRDDT